MSTTAAMNIQTLQFGTLEVEPDQVIRFAEGLLGFPQLDRVLHLRPEGWEPIEFLIPVTEPRLSFPIVNPYLVRPDYTFDLSEADRRSLGLERSNGLVVYAVTTFGQRAEDTTINLVAPVLINPATREGRQVVLERAGYTVSEPLMLAASMEGTDAGHPAETG